MLHEGTLVERLGRWVRREIGGKPVFEVVAGPGRHVIEEAEDAGRACVTCEIPEGHVCVVFRLHGQDSLFGFLRERENADGAFLMVEPSGEISAWIVECKKTLDARKWDKAIKQFTWTLARLSAVAGVIGVELGPVVFATAFREDRLSPEESPNPALGKAVLGGRSDSEEEPRRRQLAWVGDRVVLPGLKGSFGHAKIRLDAAGNGAHLLGRQAPLPAR